jgi:RNA-binding protein
MAELTPRQRALLRSLAHSLKPIQHVGKDGVTDALVSSVEGALQTRELLKVRVLDTAPTTAADAGQELADRIPETHLVQVIGRTAVLYRRHPQEPKIALPD